MKRDPSWGLIGFEFYLFRNRAIKFVNKLSLDERMRVANSLRLLADILERHPINQFHGE